MDGMHGGNACEICYEMYYIKEEQLKLLLAGLGQTMWYGLFSKAPESSGISGNSSLDLDDIDMTKTAAVNSLLADLYQDGVIDWEGAGIAVNQPYSAMLASMLERKVCVTIHITGDESHVRCCYLSNEFVVLTRKSQREGDTIGIAKIPMQYWIGMVEEECIRLEDGECLKLVWRSSENGQAFCSVKIQKDGLRTVKIKQKNEQKNEQKIGQKNKQKNEHENGQKNEHKNKQERDEAGCLCCENEKDGLSAAGPEREQDAQRCLHCEKEELGEVLLGLFVKSRP